MTRLINSFPRLFSDVPMRTHVLEHDINVGDHSPIKQSPYRVNPTKRKIMEAEVKYLVEMASQFRVLAPGVPRVCWFQNPTAPNGFVRITGR